MITMTHHFGLFISVIRILTHTGLKDLLGDKCGKSFTLLYEKNHMIILEHIEKRNHMLLNQEN